MKKHIMSYMLLGAVLALSGCAKGSEVPAQATTAAVTETEAAAQEAETAQEADEAEENEEAEKAALKPISFAYTETNRFRIPEDPNVEAQVNGFVEGARVTEPGYDALNAALQDLENKMIDEVRTEMESFSEFLEEDELDEFTLSMLPYYSEEGCVVTRSDSRLFGISYGYSSFAGGAHPYSCQISYHFDPETGKEITLRDISSDPEAFLRQIKKRLAQMDEAEYFFDDYESTVESAFNERDLSWNFAKDGLWILFNQYDIAPYAMGVQEINFSYGELRPFIYWDYLMSEEEAAELFEAVAAANEEHWLEYDEVGEADPRFFVSYHESEYVFPDSDTRLLTEADLEGKALYEIRRGLNELYARRGRLFNGGAMTDYFAGKSWYAGSISAEAFDDSVFTKTEHQNVDLLAAQLKKLSGGRNITKTETEAQKFLMQEGVNGLMWDRFADLQVDSAGVYDIVYQLHDQSVDMDALVSGLEASGEEIYTDISAITSLNLDRFLRKITGCGIGEANWDFSGLGYYEPMTVYYIQHGDTNYSPLEVELMNADGRQIDLLCKSEYMLDEAGFVVTLEETKDSFRVVSVRNATTE